MDSVPGTATIGISSGAAPGVSSPADMGSPRTGHQRTPLPDAPANRGIAGNAAFEELNDLIADNHDSWIQDWTGAIGGPGILTGD